MGRSKTSTTSVLSAGSADPVDTGGIKQKLLDGMTACGGYASTAFIKVGPTDVIVDKDSGRVYVGSGAWDVVQTVPTR